MPDFPTGVPDVPSMVPGNGLATAHGATAQSTAMNRVLLNVRALATKLGTVVGTPTQGKLLRGETGGGSSWASRATGATLLVAANDASAASKAQADYVCDGAFFGTADEVEINAALAALPSGGGSVRLSEGTFVIAAQVATTKANSHLFGAGMDATTLRVPNGGGVPVDTSIVRLNHNSCSLRDLTIDGNKANNAIRVSMICASAVAADGLIESVRATNSPAYGFFASNATTGLRIARCLADGCDQGGFFLRSASEAGRLLATGCIARTCLDGFIFDNGPVTLLGCAAVSNTEYGFYSSAGWTRLLDCDAYGNADLGFYLSGTFSSAIGCRAIQNASHGFQTSGADILIAGCHAIQNAKHGVVLDQPRQQVVGCRAIDNGTLTNATYSGIAVIGANDSFADGNFVRQGVAVANKQLYGIAVASGSNTLVGHNDLYNGGSSLSLIDNGANTRRTVKQQLNYVAAADIFNNTAIPGSAWTNVGTAQSFRVDAATGLVTIALSGHIMVGPTATGTYMSSRLLIDGATPYQLGGLHASASYTWGNPFSGANTVAIAALAVGTHTVISQIYVNVATVAYLRLSIGYEPYGIQVLEYAR